MTVVYLFLAVAVAAFAAHLVERMLDEAERCARRRFDAQRGWGWRA